VLAVFFVPVFYVVMQRLSELRLRPRAVIPVAARATITEHDGALAASLRTH
jgi:hypothetical protein